MNKSFLFVIMMVAASFTGCIGSEDSDEILTDPVGEVNVPGNALVFTRDADSTECSNGGIILDVGSAHHSGRAENSAHNIPENFWNIWNT